MKSLLEFVGVVSVIVAILAIGWAAMGIISTDQAISPDETERAARTAGAQRAGLIAIGAIILATVSGRLRKRLT